MNSLHVQNITSRIHKFSVCNKSYSQFENSKWILVVFQRIIGANTIVQGALPSILKDTPASFFNETLDIIEANAKLSFEKLSQIPGLRPVMPSGAMYMMVGIDRAGFSKDFSNDLEIVEAMVTEQSVFCLPGKCFNIPNFFRIVLTVPGNLMAEACDRIAEFCEKHYDIHARFEQNCVKTIQNKDDNYESSGFSNGSSSSSGIFCFLLNLIKEVVMY